MNLTTGPSSWDRDMQGLDEEESQNLIALGMHVTGAKAGDDDEEEEKKKDEDDDETSVEKAIAAESGDNVEEEEKKDEPEELDELKELERLAKAVKEDDEPNMAVDEDE